MPADVESITRARIRALRRRLGWSLEDLAQRCHLSVSTLSRIETGKRTISLDVLVAVAQSLGVTIDELLAADDDADVVIRPTPAGWEGATVWTLSRPGATTTAIKMRLEPTDRAPEPQLHPGHDWLFVLDGPVLLTLGERQIVVQTGEAAEFSTMTPHAVAALGRPAELIMVFDREGEHAHLHRATAPGPPARAAPAATRRARRS
jgi:transcriptional regulator with XRE-family HTH domain